MPDEIEAICTRRDVQQTLETVSTTYIFAILQRVSVNGFTDEPTGSIVLGYTDLASLDRFKIGETYSFSLVDREPS
jgi:hypothetical protein